MSEQPKANVERRKQFKRQYARDLRNNSTREERWLWKALCGDRMAGFRFRRQQPIGPYIVDFFCPAAKLVVELDGNQHYEEDAVAYDEARTRWLEAQGCTVLRFKNEDVRKERHVALDRIWFTLTQKKSDIPSP
jgi:very-short-patch-repair endonuclease